jgi:hypothetical protein
MMLGFVERRSALVEHLRPDIGQTAAYLRPPRRCYPALTSC